MFRTNVPVTSGGFHDRTEALRSVGELMRRAKSGAPRWLAILGPRKVGKTSLVMEAARRGTDPALAVVMLDVQEVSPPTLELFRVLALRVLDAALGGELGASLERLAARPADYRAALQRSRTFGKLTPSLRADILELADRPVDTAFARRALELPELLAKATKLRFVVALDEFQELASLGGGRVKIDVFPLMRSVWQKHERVGYLVSGSERTLLADLVTSKHSPFFQHFDLLEVGPFSTPDAVELLVSASPNDRPIPRALAERAVGLLGGHPFYLQLLGEALTALDPPYDVESLKIALSNLLFSRTGRLSLFFESEHARVVGRSAAHAALLDALAGGPLRHSELSKAIGAPSGATARYLERVGDAVVHLEDGRYALSDPTFALWLRWRRPGGSVVPMSVLGDEAEQRVAEELARLGFDLVYQSRASRGAFDLLALRGALQLGVQVKRAKLPVRFSRSEWTRMEAEGLRLGWKWVIAVTSDEEGVQFLDPDLARSARQVTLDEDAEVDNLLLWLG